MIRILRPYEGYRDTGLTCLPRIPKHWPLTRCGNLFRHRRETGFRDLPVFEVSIKSGVRRRDQVENARKQEMSDPMGYQRVEKSDIVYNMMRMWQGACGVAPSTGLVSPAYVVAIPGSEADPAYYAELLRTENYLKEIEFDSRGIVPDRNRLYWEAFKQIPVPLPSHSEQDAIIRFIRHIDARINRLIRAKRRLIELLTEQQQKTVDGALMGVAGRVNRFKSSGVDGLGDIPQEWRLKKFKFVTSIIRGQVDPQVSPYRQMILIAPNHIEKGTGRLLFEETAEDQGADSGKYLVRRGQVVYSKIRPNLQKATIALRDCLCSADMYPIEPQKEELLSEYLLLLMLSKPFTQYVVDSSMRVAMPKVNRDALGNAWLWYPSIEEQIKILRHISAENRQFSDVIQRTRNEIELIREYRTRLVSDVVTGQLDVRHVDLPAIDEQLAEEIGDIDDSEDADGTETDDGEGDEA